MTDRYAPPRRDRAQPQRQVLTDPVRFPAGAAAPVLIKRAFVLILMTLLVPGSAQIIAGNRRLGRAALRVTFTVWALVLVAVLLALFGRSLLISLVTHPLSSLLLVIGLAVLAVGWAALFINTLRLIRPVLLAPGRRRSVVAALVLALVLSSGSLGYAAYLLNVGRNAIGSIFSVNSPGIEPSEGRYNFLMMGGDAGADRTGRRPDSLSVISVDAKTGKTAIISIPRNLQNAQFSEDSPMRRLYPDGYDCGDECLINAINTEVTNEHQDLYPGVADPGAQATLEAVSGTLGIKVQAYVLVDMEGFSKLIDAMGGIRIKAGGWVPMSGYFDEARGLHDMPLGWIPAGDQKLDGFQALWYGRSREFVDDYARIQRQQCVQQAMLKQLDPATLLAKFEGIAEAGTKVVDSNISASQLGSFVNLALKAKGQEMSRLTIGPPDFDVSFSTVPDFELIRERVRQLLGATPAKAAEGATGQPAAPAAPAAPAPEAPAPAAPAAPEAPRAPAAEPPASGFTPVTHTPDGELITEEMLNELKRNGDEQSIRNLVATNGQCAPL